MQTQYTPSLPIETLIPLFDASGDCWEWAGTKTPSGYGSFGVKIDGKWRNRVAHRLVWIALCGPIPDGLTMDHLCRVRHCVNPDHLEPVVARVNILRGYGASALNAKRNRCKRGHDALIEAPRSRVCRVCRRACNLKSELKTLVERNCEICGVPFKTRRYDVSRVGRGLVCSLRCAARKSHTMLRAVCQSYTFKPGCPSRPCRQPARRDSRYCYWHTLLRHIEEG